MSPEKSSILSRSPELARPEPVEGVEGSHFTTSVRRLIPFILGGLGILLMVGGIVINNIKSPQPSLSPEILPASTPSGEVKKIKIDISGAVEKPNVYEIPYDSRVQDVLITAGGLSPKADRNYLSKNINLAQKLSDGMKIYIPFLGEAPSNLSNLSNVSHLINLNSASESELDTLPGIGPVTAQKIISARPYGQIDELISKKVVSQSVWLKIKDLVRI